MTFLPSLVGRSAMFAYDFQTNPIPGEPPGQEAYWRDVGTIGAFYEANLDLRAVSPALNLYNKQWPLRTASYSGTPRRSSPSTTIAAVARPSTPSCLVAASCPGASVRNSVLSRWVRVHSGAVVEDSIIFDNCDIGRRARIRRAILDKNVRIPEDAIIGFDLAEDRKRSTCRRRASW